MNCVHSIDESSTSRLILRRPMRADEGAAYAIHANPLTNQYNPFGPATSAASNAALADWIDHWDTHRFGYWAIALKEAPDQIIGFGGIVRKLVAERYGLNLYFRFDPSTWGRGLGTEVAMASLQLAFIILEEAKVLAKVRTNNLPSRRVLEKLGMSVEDEIEDVSNAAPSLIYAINRSEFISRVKTSSKRCATLE